MSSITKTFEESQLMDLVDAELGGKNYLLIKGLFDHARSLEAMMKKHEWVDVLGRQWCAECKRYLPHAPDCQLAKLLDGVE